jgi:hypothetical protein
MGEDSDQNQAIARNLPLFFDLQQLEIVVGQPLHILHNAR